MGGLVRKNGVCSPSCERQVIRDSQRGVVDCGQPAARPSLATRCARPLWPRSRGGRADRTDDSLFPGGGEQLW